jgi:hypothetical protein
VRGLLLVVAVAALLATAGVPSAGANGDPASDILLVQDVYTPNPPPSAGAVAALKGEVARAYSRGYRVKVAVIATAADLGLEPAFFGKPGAYARFLGGEIQRLYAGPLLIVMAAGFGIYDAGRPTEAEDRVLSHVTVKDGSADDLVGTAVRAVQELLAAGALRSRDITPPYVAMLPATGRRGGLAQLRLYLSDDSKKAAPTIRISDGAKTVAVIRYALQTVSLGAPLGLSWRVPRTLHRGSFQTCLTATDPTGNHSVKACSALKIT